MNAKHYLIIGVLSFCLGFLFREYRTRKKK